MAGGRPGRPPGRPRGSGRPRGPGRPPGRPRRYSDSTVASVDPTHISYVQETSALKSTKLTNSDEWPCFVLQEAVVYRKSNDGQLIIANVCNVDLEGPFVIRGKLDIDLSEQKHLLRNYSYKSAYIEIPVSHSYSIGFGPWAAVWASGKAGWYEINPAPEYEAMYETVCEGITLYYKVMDAYKDHSGRLPKAKRHKAYQMPIEKLLFKYAVAVGDGVTLPEAQRRCQEHAPFILAKFEDLTDINWSSTSFKRWMTASHESLVRQLEEARNKPQPPPAHSPETEDLPDSPKAEDLPDDISIDLPMRISPETDQGTRSKSSASKASDGKDIPAAPRIETPIYPPALPPVRPSPTAVSPLPQVGATSSTASQDPVRFLKDVIEEVLAEQGGDTSKVTETRVHSQMHIKCSLKAYRAAKEVTHFYARPLVASLPSKWYPSPFFQWLKNARDQPWQPEILTKEEVPGQCKRRNKISRVVPGSGLSGVGSNISLLRGAGKSYPLPSALTSRTGGLRPGFAAKRPAVFDDEDTDDGRARKAAKTEHKFEDAEEEEEEGEGEEGDDDDDDDDDDEEEVNGPHVGTPPPADGLAPDLPMETVRVVARAEKIPTMSPSGPIGTWKCEEPGCSYIVRSAEDYEGKDLIAKHFLDHSTRVDKLDLALAEGTRGRMPISHLLEKIRRMGERSQKKEQGQVDGVDVPRPLKRRLIA